MQIGDRLKELRINKGLSMDDIAKIIGVSSSSVISRYENKQTKPKEKYIIKYSNYFNVSVDWIKYGDLEDYIFDILMSDLLEKNKEIFNTPLLNKFNDDEVALSKYFSKRILSGEYSTEDAKEQGYAVDREEKINYIYDLSKKMARLWNNKHYPNQDDLKKLYNFIKSQKPIGIEDIKEIISKECNNDIVDVIKFQSDIFETFYIQTAYKYSTHRITEDDWEVINKWRLKIKELADIGNQLYKTLSYNSKEQTEHNNK